MVVEWLCVHKSELSGLLGEFVMMVLRTVPLFRWPTAYLSVCQWPCYIAFDLAEMFGPQDMNDFGGMMQTPTMNAVGVHLMLTEPHHLRWIHEYGNQSPLWEATLHLVIHPALLEPAMEDSSEWTDLLVFLKNHMLVTPHPLQWPDNKES